MVKRTAWMKIVAVVASGLLVAGLVPPYRMGWLVWVAMLPLLWALWSVQGKRAGLKGFALGWFAGAVSFGVQLSWLNVVSSLGAALLPMYLAIFWGLFGAFAATLGNPWRKCGMRSAQCAVEDGAESSLTSILPTPRSSLRTAFWLAAVWAGLEWLRGWWFTGFSWNTLGEAFENAPLMAQAADLLGLAGLSILPLFCQAVGLQAVQRFMRGSRRFPLDLAVAVSVIAITASYGYARIQIERSAEKIRLKSLLVQINIPQDAAQVLWSALDVHMAYEDETLKALDSLKKSDPAHWPDWVMWPESALTGRILSANDGTWGTWRENQETIAQVRGAGPFQLIFGVNELEAEKRDDEQLVMKENGRAWNSIAVMSPDDALQTYRKHHLVIFGETIPFVDSIPLLKTIYEQQSGAEYHGSFTAGESFDPLTIPTATGKTIGAIPTVCFEDSVARLVRKFVRPGPQVIVNVTNDGWFKESAAADQHFANARFRAIELRRPMLRCANSGVSAAIDSTGSTAHPDTGKTQILTNAQGSHFTRGSLLAELDVPVQPSFSLYAQIGDWGVISLAFASLLWAQCRRSS